MSLRQFISSREFLRSFSSIKVNANLQWKEVASIFSLKREVFDTPRHRKIKTPVTAILVGGANRGTIYADYSIIYPEEL